MEVVSEYVDLKRAGQNYKALCPFHSEKTPSFVVSPDKQLFHCFGCGVGGDLVGFVKKYENVSFEETLERLARRAGLEYRPGRGHGRNGEAAKQEAQAKEALRKVLTDTLAYYREALKGSKKASGYIQKRGISQSMAERFSLGYAPAGWHGLHKHLTDKGHKETLLIESGVLAQGDKGPYDFMRNRVIFPISDVEGGIIAFGGRVMDDSMPKYLNSPDTPLFHKSATLYGLDAARESIRKKGYTVLVEGYMDAILCHQFGFPNTVAPLGTALTKGHLKALRRFARKVAVVFDGDDAGLKAAKRALALLIEEDFRTKVLLLPLGEDPDSMLNKHGAEHMRKLLAESLGPVDFLIKAAKGDRVDMIKESVEVLSGARDRIVREELLRELSDRTRLRESIIRAEAEKVSARRGRTSRAWDAGGAGGAGPAPDFANKPYDEELLLLSVVLKFPEKAEDIFKRVGAEDFTNPLVKELLGRLAKPGMKEPTQAAQSEEEKTLVSKLSLKPGFDDEGVDKIVEDCSRKILRRRLDEELRAAEIAGDLEAQDRILNERQRLMKERLYG